MGTLVAAPFLLLVFPDGRFPTGRIWIGIAWLLGLGTGAAVVYAATAVGPMAGISPGVPQLANPVGLLMPGPTMMMVRLLSAWLYQAGTLLGVLVLLHRFSAGTDIER